MKLEETSKIQLDIKSLIGLIFGIVSIAGIWFNLTAEIARLERDLESVQTKSNANSEWVNNFEPPKQVQETVEELKIIKIKTALIEYKVEQLLKNK
tara:strand:- start:293 stop:580 length:288 start_codon:yes stop_codon:yes gene_type:complete